MKSKCGLGVLMLAALLSAIAIWLLPVNAAAADILMLLTGGGVTHTTTQTETYDIQTYGKIPALKSVSLEVTSTPNISDFVTDFKENLTLPVVQTEYPVTSDNDIFSTQSPESSWIIANVTSDDQIDTVSVTGTHINNHTHFYPSLYFTADVMENDKTVCNSGPNNAEILAIVIGAGFLTILFSALLYQFTVFLRNRKAQRDSSVFIIENELQKYDIEANGVEPDTRL
ncbi:uncharacterized protein RB166_021572 [Leptodactylus fuscus]